MTCAYFARSPRLHKPQKYVPEGANPQAFARNLKRLRQLAGYTQAGLARQCALHKTTIAKLEMGLTRPHPDTASLLAFELYTTPERLWGL